MSDTPRTLDVLTQILDRDGRLDDDNAPFVLVRLAKNLELRFNAANDIIHDLLANPYPADLIAIRRRAQDYASESLAKAYMSAYCTEEFALKARADWQASQNAAKEWLKNSKES